MRVLGATGIEVPVVGFGVSGPHGGVVSRRATIRLVRACLDAGFSLFDTAPFYGDCETRLGDALREWRGAAPVIATKVGTARRLGRVVKDFSAAAIRASVARSRAVLGVDCLDIVLLHGPAGDLAQSDALRDVMLDLKSSGQVRAVGVCGRGDEVGSFAASGWIDVIQAPLPFAAVAARSGLGFLAIEALRSPATDFRIPTRPEDLWYLARAVRQRGAGARPTTSDSDDGPPLRLARALQTPGVGSVVVTTTRRAHLLENFAIARRACAS